MNDIPAQRVKVLKAEYHKESDTISWQVKLADGRVADLVWLRDNYGEVFRIKELMPVSIVEESCQKVLGNSYNLQVDPEPPSSR
jgi:hypothetical protein